MTPHEALTVVACTGLLGLAVVSAIRASRSTLAGPLGFLCLVLFGWNFATLAHEVSGLSEWRYLDVGISPLTAPTALHFTVAFVGARRRLGWVVRAAYAVLGILSVVSISALFAPWARDFAGSSSWALLHVLAMLPFMTLCIVLMVRHARRVGDAREQMRTRLVLWALVVGTAFGSTELVADLGANVPRLGNAASLGAAALLASATFRVQLLGRDPSRGAAAMALAAGAVAVLAYLGVFRFLGWSEAMLVLGTATVTLALLVALIPMLAAISAQRDRRERHALLGRMSEQMAHDLKNPVAAVKGAVQFLQAERAAQRSLDAQVEFLDLIEAETDRVARLLDRYRSLGRMEPVLVRASVNEVVKRVAEAAQAAGRPGITLRCALAEDVPELELDIDLIATALDNLVANAVEAMPGGGTVTLSTGASDGTVWISVGDEGAGMDARTRELALEEFYTTKAHGSGLGLSFVRRVAEAHQGFVVVDSVMGAGTTVTIRFLC